jgi:hypothetical protein
MEKKLLNTILQIDESEHLDKERMIIRYLVDENIESKIVNVEDLDSNQKQTYDSFIQLLNELT